MQGGILRRTTSSQTTSKDSSRNISESDVLLSFQIAKANAKRNTIIAPVFTLSRIHSSQPRDLGARDHSHDRRNVHFFDELHTCPQNSSDSCKCFSRSGPFRLKSAQSQPQTAQISSQTPNISLQHHGSIKFGETSIPKDPFPDLVSSFVGGWKDAMHNEIFLSLTPPWLNVPKK